MFSYFAKDLPVFMKKELEGLFEKLTPLLKKNAKYKMFALPLLFFSVINLILWLMMDGLAYGFLIVYALIAAIGVALYKESRHIKKQIRTIEQEHMVDRIQTSDVINDYQKKDYISIIKSQPRLSLQTFLQFLTEENDRKNRMTG
ncbi:MULTISPECIES: DUF5392 family protein [Gracilibacillus]|uniref:DUF5392 family protein n=1 Tax=Gracilibacillus TaxID=74385 RepID=UPI000825F083|nr:MULTISPECIES: DUF5392 family protein [Gracilibacillus]